jgi:molecular chaperone GrpE
MVGRVSEPQDEKPADPAPDPEPQADPKPAPDAVSLLTAERDRLKDQLLRTAADYDNFRKRARKDLDEVARRAKEDAVREILPVADNLERALEAAASAKDVQGVVDGVKMVLKLFADTLERLGIERVPAVGARFDPQVHEAIQQVESDTHEPGTIVAELVAGYKLGDRLVRAAMVAVARPPAKPDA